MITLHISFHNNRRGRGFWKLNTSFLQEEDYLEQIETPRKNSSLENSRGIPTTIHILPL